MCYFKRGQLLVRALFPADGLRLTNRVGSMTRPTEASVIPTKNKIEMDLCVGQKRKEKDQFVLLYSFLTLNVKEWLYGIDGQVTGMTA